MKISSENKESAIATLILLVAAPAWAQSLDDLKNDGSNTDNVLTYGMGYSQHRYSPLAQINKRTSSAWCRCGRSSLAERVRRAGAAARLQRRDVRRPTPKWTVAIDVATGKQIWRTPVDFDPGDAARGVLRRFEQGRRDLQRQGLPHHARRARRRARPEDRQGALEAEGRRMEGRLFA